MPIVGPLLSALLVIATVTGMAVTTQRWSQQRNAALYAEIEADIEKTLRQHNAWKAALAASELQPPQTTGAAAAAETEGESKARKAQTSAIRKRTAGPRRERFLPPDFARLPISMMRSALGFQR